MTSRPGTYVLLLRSESNTTVRIGRWGEIAIEPGWYLYVGSAFGPGGLRARLSRHFRRTKRKHWHIDYLRENLNPRAAWYSQDAARLEHRWAGALGATIGMAAVKGFGCSDCRCHSHLFHTRSGPDIAAFSAEVGVVIETYDA